MSNHFGFKLIAPDGTEIMPLWKVLASCIKYGFRPTQNQVKSRNGEGTTLHTQLVDPMGERGTARAIAFRKLLEDLGPECAGLPHRRGHPLARILSTSQQV